MLDKIGVALHCAECFFMFLFAIGSTTAGCAGVISSFGQAVWALFGSIWHPKK